MNAILFLGLWTAAFGLSFFLALSVTYVWGLTEGFFSAPLATE